ncbi:hypothetical protein Aab01nite_34090 [Paractinoplanes abujensis]|nr:hypothetical protein Aab01nite_34090 [Actinoplanes abujensis]
MQAQGAGAGVDGGFTGGHGPDTTVDPRQERILGSGSSHTGTLLDGEYRRREGWEVTSGDAAEEAGVSPARSRHCHQAVRAGSQELRSP